MKCSLTLYRLILFRAPNKCQYFFVFFQTVIQSILIKPQNYKPNFILKAFEEFWNTAGVKKDIIRETLVWLKYWFITLEYRGFISQQGWHKSELTLLSSGCHLMSVFTNITVEISRFTFKCTKLLWDRNMRGKCKNLIACICVNLTKLSDDGHWPGLVWYLDDCLKKSRVAWY